MIGQSVFSIAFKRKDKAKTLANISSVKVAPERTIDPGLLFQRFLVVSKLGVLSLEYVMKYEPSPFPPALFKARKVLRKPDKPQLANAITDYATKASGETHEATGDAQPKTQHYVLDGGSLLQRLSWKKGETYGSIAQSYAEFTIRRNPSATVVLDGYLGGPTIKENTHQRRGKNVHPVISFTEETVFAGKKDEVLSRDRNKQNMIDLISEKLGGKGCEVINAPGDADVQIVKAAVLSSLTRSTTLIGEDTDLLILLLHYMQQANKDLYFRSDKANCDKLYHINELKIVLGEELCSQLLFLHAYTGCDTTSRIFGVGKKSSVFHKLVKGDATLKYCANSFPLPKQTAASIVIKGCQAMAVIFGDTRTDSLSSLRYNVLGKKVVSSQSFVIPERLPPTESATNFHCLRVYYQIMVWLGQESDIDTCEWGWKREGSQFVPTDRT